MSLWGFSTVLFIILAFLAIAFITLLERKILGLSQLRLGPNKNSIYGILQPVLDGLKLLFKKNSLLFNKQLGGILLGPTVVFFVMISMFMILPWSLLLFSFKYSLLLFFSLVGINSYGIMLVGWGATSVFSKLGSSRGILQSLAVEISLIIFFFITFCNVSSFSMNMDKDFSECFLFWVILLMILALVDCNRAPMDLLEGESELISGFNLELGSVVFVFIFLGEYGMMMIFSYLSMSIYSAHKSLLIFMSFSLLFLFLRSCFPRVRYEQLMFLMWQEFLLFSLLLLMLLILI